MSSVTPFINVYRRGFGLEREIVGRGGRRSYGDGE
jgi:hypothetical protein